jgi:dipeptidyl aminopeptidase/acylaminoacyl peptidase
MTRSRLIALLLTIGAVLAWLAVKRERHPDTSSVPPYAPYVEIGGDIAPSWSPDDNTLVFCRFSAADAQLYKVPANGGTPTTFLADIPEGCLPAWSPDGSHIAFTSKHSGTFHLMRALGLAEPINIWTAGANSDSPRQLTDENAGFLDPSWSPDAKQIAFTALPGPRIMTVRASGGAATLVGHGLSPDWSPDGKRLAYVSSQSGGFEAPFRIVIQSADGGRLQHLDSVVIESNFVFRPSVDWSANGERLLAVQPETGSWQPIIVNVPEDRLERVVRVEGSVISPRWSHDGTRVAYAVTDTGHPPSIQVLTFATHQTTTLTHSRGYTTAQLVRLTSSGNREIPSWLYLPPNAVLGKHPALVWLHGGLPGTGSAANEFDASIQYFVDQGFVVLAPNYRGSAGFGDELARFGEGDDIVPDVRAAADYLKGLKAVDPTRIGAIGFSFGGYLVLRSIIQSPELFAAAVDFFGAADVLAHYQDHPAMRDRLHQLLGDTLEQNRPAYVAASPINFVERIKTPLLILHGSRDVVVSYSQSVQLSNALRRARKQHEFIAYRFAGHGFSGQDDVDAKQQAMRFFLTHLKWSPTK